MSSAERPAATLRLPNGLAYGMAVAAVAALVILPFALAARGLSLGEAVDGYYLNTAIGFAVLGALILRRHPGHVIGWVLVATGGFDTLVRFSNEYVFFGLGDRPGFPSSDTVTALFAWMWVPTVAGAVIALPQLFPDGRLLGPRWRWPAVLGALATVLLSVVFALYPSSSANDTTDLVSAVFPVFGLAMLASFVPLVVRYRRSHGVERQQLKWVFYGLAVGIPLMVVGTAGALVGASPGWSLIPVLIIPVTITVAVLRYRLYDIDLVISKTLLVAGLAAFITAAYVAIVVGVGSLVETGSEPDLVLSVVATAVVAVAFQPVRRALRRVADRLVYGHRATPYDVLSGFATRVGAAEPSPDTLVQLAELMAGGTGADPARVWLRVGTRLRPAVTWPRDRGDEPAAVDLGPVGAPPALPDADLAVPVRERGELLGVLTIAKPRGERVTEVDSDLVERLAVASGVVLRNLRLDAELAQRLADIEASRRRLVTAQDDARRRIEADLAGGSRAQLAALRTRLSSLVRDVDPYTAPKTAVLLGQLVTAADGALETLSGLAAGVYPPRLAADGLAAALVEQAGKATVPVSVHAAGLGRYAGEVEAAVYFSVLEALQNVVKYADATSVQVRLHQDGGRLRFVVADDGVGFDVATASGGTGLQGIADRLDTVGGIVKIDSNPGAGTTITGEVPAAAAAPTTVADQALAGAAR